MDANGSIHGVAAEIHVQLEIHPSN
jgi:hypothetical protein